MSSTKTKVTSSVAAAHETCLFIAKILGHNLSGVAYDYEMSPVYQAERTLPLSVRSAQFIFKEEGTEDSKEIVFWLVLTKTGLGQWEVVSVNFLDPEEAILHTLEPKNGLSSVHKLPIDVELDLLKAMALGVVAETLGLIDDLGEGFKTDLVTMLAKLSPGLTRTFYNPSYQLVFRGLESGRSLDSTTTLEFEALAVEPYFKITEVRYKKCLAPRFPEVTFIESRKKPGTWLRR